MTAYMVATAEEKQAQNIMVLDFRGVSILFDFCVIATGTSRIQTKAIARAIDRHRCRRRDGAGTGRLRAADAPSGRQSRRADHATPLVAEGARVGDDQRDARGDRLQRVGNGAPAFDASQDLAAHFGQAQPEMNKGLVFSSPDS